MATFSFDRPIIVSPEGAEKLADILSKPTPPLNPVDDFLSDIYRKENEKSIGNWFKSKGNKE
ncbi:MAG: hypothetical protein NC299_17810 [Lachnospiraceae bacterium]|nr:hypothetical protein [Lachnospiraceae bacterium]